MATGAATGCEVPEMPADAAAVEPGPPAGTAATAELGGGACPTVGGLATGAALAAGAVAPAAGEMGPGSALQALSGSSTISTNGGRRRARMQFRGSGLNISMCAPHRARTGLTSSVSPK